MSASIYDIAVDRIDGSSTKNVIISAIRSAKVAIHAGIPAPPFFSAMVRRGLRC